MYTTSESGTNIAPDSVPGTINTVRETADQNIRIMLMAVQMLTEKKVDSRRRIAQKIRVLFTNTSEFFGS